MWTVGGLEHADRSTETPRKLPKEMGFALLTSLCPGTHTNVSEPD